MTVAEVTKFVRQVFTSKVGLNALNSAVEFISAIALKSLDFVKVLLLIWHSRNTPR